MLNIDNLHAQVDDKDILQGLSLTVNPGEVHAIMGPNGSGKSTLASVLAGLEEYEITDGEIIYSGADLTELDAETRARLREEALAVIEDVVLPAYTRLGRWFEDDYLPATRKTARYSAPGATVRLEILRDSKVLMKEVKLGAWD